MEIFNIQVELENKIAERVLKFNEDVNTKLLELDFLAEQSGINKAMSILGFNTNQVN